MAGIKNRGTQVHLSKKKYNRKDQFIDDEIFDEINFQSKGVVDFERTYSLPAKISKQLGL